MIIYGAVGVFGQLHSSFDQMWSIHSDQNFIYTVKKRFSAFIILIIFAFIIIFSILADNFISLFAPILNHISPNAIALIAVGNNVVSFIAIVAAIALVFRYAPDIILPWRA